MVTDNRDDMIVNNLGLVHSIAARFRGRGMDYDDLFQAGCIGLIKAADNFDRERGFQFSTYAVPVIMGEIKRLFRDDGAIKVSRVLKEKSLKVRAMRDSFIMKNDREPTVQELAAYCQMDAEEMSEIIGLLSPVMSLSVEYEGESEEMDIPVDNSDAIFNRLYIAEATEKLSPYEKELIHLRFFLGKTQSETAKQLGVSQVQISRKEKAILLKLREYMK